MPECAVCGLVTSSSSCPACGSQPSNDTQRVETSQFEEPGEGDRLPFGLDGGAGKGTPSAIPFGLELSPEESENSKLAFGLEKSPDIEGQEEFRYANKAALFSRPENGDVSPLENQS